MLVNKLGVIKIKNYGVEGSPQVFAFVGGIAGAVIGAVGGYEIYQGLVETLEISSFIGKASAFLISELLAINIASKVGSFAGYIAGYPVAALSALTSDGVSYISQKIKQKNEKTLINKLSKEIEKNSSLENLLDLSGKYFGDSIKMPGVYDFEIIAQKEIDGHNGKNVFAAYVKVDFKPENESGFVAVQEHKCITNVKPGDFEKILDSFGHNRDEHYIYTIPRGSFYYSGGYKNFFGEYQFQHLKPNSDNPDMNDSKKFMEFYLYKAFLQHSINLREKLGFTPSAVLQSKDSNFVSQVYEKLIEIKGDKKGTK